MELVVARDFRTARNTMLALVEITYRTFYGSIVSFIIYNLIKWFLTKPSNKEFLDSMKTLTILVKINIMEDNFRKEKKKMSKRLQSLQPDTTFSQMWFGTFQYNYIGNIVNGTIEILNTEVFTKNENKEWLFNTENHSDILPIVSYLSKHRVQEIPGWNGTMMCKITLDNHQLLRYLMIPQDILLDRHSHNIKWMKKLIAR